LNINTLTPQHTNTRTHRVAVLASGSGTNAEEIFKHFRNHPSIQVVLLLSNNPQAYALERAKKYAIPSKVFTRSEFRESEEVLIWLQKRSVTHIVLAGFMWLVPDYLVKSYPHRIINIHPALLPKFGGKGMYGMHVHEAVRAAGEKETGITIHEVNEHYDEGKILFQAKCGVSSSDTADEIANKVHQLEYQHYPGVIEEWISKSR
jgi:phosphoribosylglycinamide formyltransferase-1